MKGSFIRRRPSFVVCAFRRCEASRRMWRGFGVSLEGRVGGGGVVRDFVKWVRRVWRVVVFVRRVVLSVVAILAWVWGVLYVCKGSW